MQLPSFVRGSAFRFSVLHTLTFVALVGLIGAATEVTVTQALERQAQDRVESEAVALADDFDHEGLDGLKDALNPRLGVRASRLRYAVIDPAGQTLVGDPGLSHYAGRDEPSRPAALRTSYDDPTDSIAVASRLLPGGLHIIVADDLESAEDVQQVVSGAFALAFGLAVVLGLGAGAFLTSSLLQRVDAITRTADAIIAGDLGRRVSLRGSGDDFDRLARTLNAMLDRISGLMDNLRQVTNDVAHDLRTPLSRLRQGLEHARSRVLSKDDLEEALDRAIGEADGLLDTFSALLRIAQVESDARRAAFRDTDLSAIALRVADAFAPVAEDENRHFAVDVNEGLVVHGDGELLTQMMSNLVENALRHTPMGTAVSVSLRREPSTRRIVAVVADAGLGVPSEDRDKIFRRFYRLERSRTSPGNGLGLSLVAAVADLHHASMQVLDNRPGLRVVLSFDPVR